MKKWTAGMLVGLVAANMASGADEAKPADKLKLAGDVRYRHEYIDKEGSDSQTRHRIRARIGLEAEVNEDLKAEIRLASGSKDPVSSNQTLGESFGSKSINLDLAYVTWMPATIDGLTLLGGKMTMPFAAVSDLIWDSDLTPEGLAAEWRLDAGEQSLRARVAHFWAEERKDDDDTTLLGGQLAAHTKAGGAAIVLGGSVYAFDNLKGFETLYDVEKGYGNSTVAANPDDPTDLTRLYASEFTEVEGFVEIGGKLGGLPLKLYGNYVVNTDAATGEDTGYLAGIRLGKAKDTGSMEFDYNYRDLEKDAVVGIFTDSDSFGGGTNAKGHKFSGKYQLAKNWQLGGAYFRNTLGLSGDSKDYDRIQIDLAAKF